eukprot:scaffold91871_cov23-Tisochrysis_lutea.AAC.1
MCVTCHVQLLLCCTSFHLPSLLLRPSRHTSSPPLHVHSNLVVLQVAVDSKCRAWRINSAPGYGLLKAAPKTDRPHISLLNGVLEALVCWASIHGLWALYITEATSAMLAAVMQSVPRDGPAGQASARLFTRPLCVRKSLLLWLLQTVPRMGLLNKSLLQDVYTAPVDV